MSPAVRFSALFLLSYIISAACLPPAVSAQAQQAKEAMLKGRYSDAVEIYRHLAAIPPVEPGIYFNLALALHSLGKYRDSVQQLEKIRVAAKQNPRFWFLLGVGYLKLNEPEKAVEPLRTAAKLDSSDSEARAELGSALLASARLAEADNTFRQLAEDRPDNARVLLGLSLARLALSREAATALEKIAPASSFSWGLAALAEAAAGRTDQAIAYYQRAIAGNPNAPWFSKELEALKHPTEAPVHTGCNLQSPACEFANRHWLQLTKASFKQGTAEALYWSSRAYSELASESMAKLAGLPPCPEQHELLARVYTESGHKTEAIAELREALQLRPEDVSIHAELARALWANRQFDEAAASLQELAGTGLEDPEIQFELGDALFNLGKPQEAMGHLQTAVYLDPKLLPAHAKLAEALLQTGRIAEAIPHLELAQSLDQDGSLHFQLANAYRRIGRKDLAAKVMAQQKEMGSKPRL